MDEQIKKKLEGLEKEVESDENLSSEERKVKLEDIKYAKYLLSEREDFDYKPEDKKSIDDIKKDSIKKNKEEVLKALEKPENKKYAKYFTGSTELTVKTNIENIEAEQGILNYNKFSSSDKFKEKIIKIVNKLNEYGINDSTYAGESGTKIYAFYKYKLIRDEMHKAVLKGDLGKINELHKQSEETIKKYTELLDMTRDLNSTDSIDNMDIKREKFYVPEIYNRQQAASNLNGIFQIACFCKTRDISVEDYLENPVRHNLNYLNDVSKESTKEGNLPATEPVTKRLAELFAFQSETEGWSKISYANSAAMYTQSRALEVLIKLDNGAGKDKRALVGGVMAGISNVYTTPLIYGGYFTYNTSIGIKGAILAGKNVDDLTVFDPDYINHNTLNKSQYKYEDIIKNAEIGDDFYEKMIGEFSDLMSELEARSDGHPQILTNDGVLYALADLFNDALQREDVLENKELCAKLQKFLINPEKEFIKANENLGKKEHEFEDVYDLTARHGMVGPFYCNLRELNGLYKDYKYSETLQYNDINAIFKGLKTMEINDMLRGEKPKFPHLIDMYRYNRDKKLNEKITAAFRNKLKEFGYSDKKIDLLVHNNEARLKEIKAGKGKDFIKISNLMEEYNKAFQKGTLDDLTPEQKEAYLNPNGFNFDLGEEAKTILGGNGINSYNLKTAIEIYNTVKDLPNGKDFADQIKEELTDKGLTEDLFNKATMENANYEEIVSTLDLNRKEKIEVDLEEGNDFELEGLEDDAVSKVVNKESEMTN